MRSKPEIGQKVFSLNVGNAARYRDQELTSVTITKVGRKYFTVGAGFGSVQYHLDDWSEKTEYSANSCIYETEQEWADEKESDELYREISRFFSMSGRGSRLPLKNLRKISDLIKGE